MSVKRAVALRTLSPPTIVNGQAYGQPFTGSPSPHLSSSTGQFCFAFARCHQRVWYVWFGVSSRIFPGYESDKDFELEWPTIPHLAALQTTSFTQTAFRYCSPTAMQVAQIARRLLEDAMAPAAGHPIDKASWQLHTNRQGFMTITLHTSTSTANQANANICKPNDSNLRPRLLSCRI